MISQLHQYSSIELLADRLVHYNIPEFQNCSDIQTVDSKADRLLLDTVLTYLINSVIKNSTTDIVEVYDVVWEKWLDAGNGIHRRVKVPVEVIWRGGKNELGRSFTVREVSQWKSESEQCHWVLVQWQLCRNLCVSFLCRQLYVRTISKLFDQRRICRRVCTG